ncbi:unnamed protein product, partial [Larinioides sclopetarius]
MSGKKHSQLLTGKNNSMLCFYKETSGKLLIIEGIYKVLKYPCLHFRKVASRNVQEIMQRPILLLR